MAEVIRDNLGGILLLLKMLDDQLIVAQLDKLMAFIKSQDYIW